MPNLVETYANFFGVTAKGTLEETLSGKLPTVVGTYVTAFGADPTGVNDSTAAINAAIAALPANGALVFAPGTYLVTNVLNPIPANTTISGAGEYTTTISTSIASGTLFTLTGATSTLQNMTITNTNASNTAAVVSHAANQVTLNNLTVTGFGSTSGIISMTSAATYGNVFNVYISSTLSNAVGIAIAGADTVVQGCTFVSLTTGMSCSANDRFSVVDNVFKSCTTAILLSNTTANGTTTFDGIVFDGCTTAVSIAPGTGQTVQAVAFDACVFEAATTGASIAPTSTGQVNYVSFDGCMMVSAVNSATALVVNGAGSNSVQYVTVDGCDIVFSGTSSVGFTYTAGGNAAAPISFMNCDFNCTTNFSTAVGSANNLPFVVRGCVGVNPVGKLSSQPATSASAVTNNTGCDVTVALVIGSTGTTVSIGGQSLGFGSQTSVNQLIRVPYGQTITTSQTTGVSWTWFGD